MHRRAIYDESLESFPHLAPWFHYSYSKSTPIYSSDSEYLFNSKVGVKQGDPLGSFLFSCWAQKSIKDVISKLPDGLNILGYVTLTLEILTVTFAPLGPSSLIQPKPEIITYINYLINYSYLLNLKDHNKFIRLYFLRCKRK